MSDRVNQDRSCIHPRAIVAHYLEGEIIKEPRGGGGGEKEQEEEGEVQEHQAASIAIFILILILSMERTRTRVKVENEGERKKEKHVTRDEVTGSCCDPCTSFPPVDRFLVPRTGRGTLSLGQKALLERDKM